MARKSAFEINVSDVQERAEKLRDLGITEDSALVQALNEFVDDVYATARGRMIAGISLTDAYVQSKMKVEHATASRGLRAAITASGSERGDQSPLGRYFNRQETVAAPRARGDRARGIAAGRKQAGISVEVSRGSVKVLPGAFTMPLKRGGQSGGNGIGIFTRSKYGLVQHRYGPAVYQLFRHAAGELEDELGDRLVQEIGPVAERALERALDK